MTTNKNRARLLTVALLVFAAGTCRAATLFLTPASQTVRVGELALLDLEMDFTDDPTLGGALEITYNAARLGFLSFEFDPALGDDPSLRSHPTAGPDAGMLTNLGFGEFLEGLSGPSRVGTLTFLALAAGFDPAVISLSENPGPPSLGPFISATTFDPQFPTLEGGTVTIIPLPQSAWLLLSALFVLLRTGKPWIGATNCTPGMNITRAGGHVIPVVIRLDFCNDSDRNQSFVPNDEKCNFCAKAQQALA